MGEGADALAAAVKDFLIAASVIALSLGIVAGVVFGLDDEGTFVSPPEVVAEEFVRALGQGRIGPARTMLASHAERVTSTADVRAISDRFRSRVGHLEHVKGTVAERKLDTVIVRARVEGARENSELTLPLVREYGSWSIAHLSELRGALDHVPSRGAPQR